MTSDRPEDPQDHPERRDGQSADKSQPTRPSGHPAETRSRPEYYSDLRQAVSADQSTESRRTAATEQAATEKWQQDSADSRSIWQEYQRKWPSTDRPKTDHAHSSDATNTIRVEAECDRIADRERDKITPALLSIESQDPDRHLVGLHHRLKSRDRIREKVDDRL